MDNHQEDGKVAETMDPGAWTQTHGQLSVPGAGAGDTWQIIRPEHLAWEVAAHDWANRQTQAQVSPPTRRLDCDHGGKCGDGRRLGDSYRGGTDSLLTLRVRLSAH